MSKEMWTKMEGVFVEELADVIRQKDCPVMVHNWQNVYFDVRLKQ